MNHHRCKGIWIHDAEHLWKIVTIMRSIADKLPDWGKSSFPQLRGNVLVCSWPWRRSFYTWVSLPTSDPLGSQSWMSGPYVGLLWGPTCSAVSLPDADRSLRGCWSCITVGIYFQSRIIWGEWDASPTFPWKRFSALGDNTTSDCANCLPVAKGKPFLKGFVMTPSLVL